MCVFASEQMRRVVTTAKRAAPGNLPVLITGETGTGKEAVARFIHQHSGRSNERFIPYNCSSSPRELVESQLFGHRRGAFTDATENYVGIVRAAQGGTLLLDEIAELDLGIQPKLLRLVENNEVHPLGQPTPLSVQVRIIAATNADIVQLVRDGLFRADLFYRLNIIHLRLPPLRERPEDVPPLAKHFLRRYCSEHGKHNLRLSGEAIEHLTLQRWQGNVRQLANEISRAVAFAENGTLLTPEHFSEAAAPASAARDDSAAGMHEAPGDTVTVATDQPLQAARDRVERALILRALRAAHGRVGRAAKRLGISRKGLFLKRQRLNIDVEQPHD